MEKNLLKNEKVKDNSSYKLEPNININYKKETNEINNNDDKSKNKFSSFNNIQISSNDNSQKAISYTYISNEKKPKSNFQISNINSNNNKYSNNNSHQGISFIAKKQNDKQGNLQTSSKINSHQEFSYIAPEKKGNKYLIEPNNYSTNGQNGISYLAPEKLNNKEYKISSNLNQSQLNFPSQGISYIVKEKMKTKDEKQNLTISNLYNNPQNTINYIAPEKKKNFNYKIEHNPSNNKDEQKGISYIAPNNPKTFLISNSNQSSHQEINYKAPEQPKILDFDISSNKNTTSNQVIFISNSSNKKYNYQLSAQNNTYSYIAPEKNEKKSNNPTKKDFKICSDNNTFIYVSKNEKENKEKDIFQFNHNQSITFICDEKKDNKKVNFSQCNADKFKYVKDDATGAQIMENEKY